MNNLRAKLPTEVLFQLENSTNIVGLSGGKDSVATCILLSRLEIPYKTVTAEVWWKKGITGENPYHYEFMHEKLFPKLRGWGVHCETVKSDITAFEYMMTPICRSNEHPERVGKLRGFPLCGACGIQRDCKTRPTEQYYKMHENYNRILGFAANEKARMKNNIVSLLDSMKVFEFETYKICNDEDLLSPTYSFSERGGCWFCPNQKIQEWELLYREFPGLWEELMLVQRAENKVQEKITRTQTLYDIENEILNGVQMKFFSANFI